MNRGYWSEKVCLVTGGSAGLGREIANELARRGAQVVLNARRETPLQQAAESIVQAGGSAVGLSADVTRDEDVQRLCAEITERFGRLDLLCNCAGRSCRGNALGATPGDFQHSMEVNFFSAVRMARAFAPLLVPERGHLVNLGSLASKFAPRFMGAYPPSKFALAAYSQQLRLELGPQGLHVLLVCPGPIAREDNSPRYADQADGLPDEANRPGGGAKLGSIQPAWLAEKILTACERRQAELVVPGRARILAAIAQLSPSLGDWILRRSTSG